MGPKVGQVNVLIMVADRNLLNESNSAELNTEKYTEMS